MSPPLLKNISNQNLSDLIESGSMPDWDIKNFPCHTQAVELCIKLITEAAQAVVDFDNLNGYICSTFRARKIMTKFNNKEQFRFEMS